MARELAAGQRARIHTIDAITGDDHIVYESDTILFEAPNWTLDGSALIVNGGGHLFRLDLAGTPGQGDTGASASHPQKIEFGELPELNNDHVLAPDGENVYFSANDWHIYRAPLAGGVPVRITNEDGRLHFLHGVSPDGSTLAYIGIEQDDEGVWGAGDIWTIPSNGGDDVALTRDRFPDDGSEYSADGEWLYFNSERADTGAGHAQLYRMRPDGTGIEQLTFDERVNWFPHITLDGSRLAFISFPPGTIGHPEDRDCILRVCAPNGDDVVDLVHLFGGQGTINVNSWSPDNRTFAYVDYPVDITEDAAGATAGSAADPGAE